MPAGMRIEPALSVPVASVVVPAASAAAAPPEEAPGVTSRFQGLRVVPCSREVQVHGQTNSGQVVWAWMMAPAFTSRSTRGSVVSAIRFSKISEPTVWRLPLIAVSSLTARGRPSRRRSRPSVFM